MIQIAQDPSPCLGVRLVSTITNGQGENDQLIFACVGESIKYGRPLNTARLLQRVFEKQLQGPISAPGLDLGSLLQYTASMLLQGVADCAPEQCLDQEILARLCYIFKHATRLGDPRNGNGKVSPRPKVDIGWFERKSFQVARAHIGIWPTRFLIDLLSHCGHLCSLQEYTTAGIAAREQSKERLHESLLIRAILYASEARKVAASYSIEDLPESSYDSKSKPKTSECQSVLYRNVFKTFTTLQQQLTNGDTSNDGRPESIKSRLHVLIPLAFEALLFLNVNSYVAEEIAFDEASISQFLKTAHELELPIASYALLADTLLAFTCDDSKAGGLRVPSIAAARLLSRIIQAIRHSQVYNIEQAARWIRCVAQLIFEDIDVILTNSRMEGPPKIDHSLKMLESVVQQAIGLADAPSSGSRKRTNVGASRTTTGGVSNSSAQRYPPEELHWLATKIWNMAIDFHGIGQGGTAQSWAGKSVKVAELVMNEDGNMMSFVVQLKDNIRSLGWSI